MSSTKQATIRVRAIIFDNEWKIFWVKHIWSDFMALPWWKLEGSESLKDCLEREIFEELWIKSKIWDLLFVHEFEHKKYLERSIEFFFRIDNFADFGWKMLEWRDFKKEIESYGFFYPEKIDFKPEFLKNMNPEQKDIQYVNMSI